MVNLFFFFDFQIVIYSICFLDELIHNINYVCSIEQNPNYLPAIFGLCAMGLLQNDDTLATAALREMMKLPIKVIGNASFLCDYIFLIL